MSERATSTDVVTALDAIGGDDTLAALHDGSHPKAQATIPVTLSDLAVLGEAAWDRATWDSTWDSTGESTKVFEALLRVLTDAREMYVSLNA